MIQAAEERDIDITEDDLNSTEPLGREEQKHQFVVMRAKGYSYARIAEELGVSKGTPVDTVQGSNLHLSPPGESRYICNLGDQYHRRVKAI